MAGSGLFEVDELIDVRRRGTVTEYLVRWKGFGEDDDTWEPESNLIHCSSALNKFLIKSPQTPERRPGAPGRRLATPGRGRPKRSKSRSRSRSRARNQYLTQRTSPSSRQFKANPTSAVKEDIKSPAASPSTLSSRSLALGSTMDITRTRNKPVVPRSLQTDRGSDNSQSSDSSNLAWVDAAALFCLGIFLLIIVCYCSNTFSTSLGQIRSFFGSFFIHIKKK